MTPAEVIEKKIHAITLVKQEKMAKLLANEMKNFAWDNFKRQGFPGDSFEPWKKRKTIYKTRNDSPLLIRSGRGRLSIRVIRADEEMIGIGSDLPYMKAHNEGFRGTVNVAQYIRNNYSKEKVGTGLYSIKTRKERMKTVQTVKGVVTVKAHTMRMNIPKRQFIGKSQYLLARLKRVYVAQILKAFNS